MAQYAVNDNENYGDRLRAALIEDLSADNNDDLLAEHLEGFAVFYADAPKGIRLIIDGVVIRMLGISFGTLIAAVEQDVTVLEAELEVDCLDDLDVAAIRRCLDEV